MADNPKPPAKRNRRVGERRDGARTAAPGGAVWYVLAVLVLLALGQAFFYRFQTGETLPYSEFKQLVRENRVQEVTLGEEQIRGTLKSTGGSSTERPRTFTAVRVADDKLPADLKEHGVKYQGEVSNRWLTEIVSWILPLLLVVALWTIFFRRIGGAEGGVMSFARSR